MKWSANPLSQPETYKTLACLVKCSTNRCFGNQNESVIDNSPFHNFVPKHSKIQVRPLETPGGASANSFPGSVQIYAGTSVPARRISRYPTPTLLSQRCFARYIAVADKLERQHSEIDGEVQI